MNDKLELTKELHATPMLGIDIGRVIIGGGAPGSAADTAFFRGGIENAIRTPAVAGALETIPALVQHFEGRACLISKCGPRVAARSRAWLNAHDFWSRTGIDPSALRFCKERKQKAIHCKDLRVTHFIDDRVGVHVHLRHIVPELFLFGPQRKAIPEWLTHLPDWDSVARRFSLAV